MSTGRIKGGEGGEPPLALPLNAALFDMFVALEKFRDRLHTLSVVISSAELDNAIQEIHEAKARQEADRLMVDFLDSDERSGDDGPASVHSDASGGVQRRPGVPSVAKHTRRQ